MSRNPYYVKTCALHNRLGCGQKIPPPKGDTCPPTPCALYGGMSRKIISTFSGGKHEG